ncbi:hypothetical protein [Chitinilyticum piscinae]|uniref:Uncharacterized protein n=1 Tax=Chitinilyticum piscinae TaxID=2866724 RepID=A0A8J7K1M6_9NEIS|nr:hypothetical protein [Chitinilyticum piscinae]MBE9609431.1 hypothetical protein [Chitinilyticum piscinae]
MLQWFSRLINPTRFVDESHSRFPPTELLPARPLAARGETHDLLKKSLIYRIKRDALHIVAELNQGTPMENCELMARQLAFVQKELIQAAYHDESIPKEQRLALAKYHAVNIRQGLGERRTNGLRGVAPQKSE